jgi:hypothetical protein
MTKRKPIEQRTSGTHVRLNRKDQLDLLSKHYGIPRSKVLDALIEEKFQSLQEEKI